jgi:hypothetical protein
MTGEPDRWAELRTLLEALCEEQITPEQMARLEDLVLSDPENEAFYIKFVHLHADLIREFAGVLPGLGEGLRDVAARGVADAPPPAPSGARQGRPLARVRLWLPWAVAAAACVALMIVVWRRPGAPLPRSATATATPSPSPSLAVAQRDAVALVIGLDGARWEPADGPPPAEGDVLATRRLRLGSGRAMLGLLSGVTLTLEGPADVDLLAVDRVFCRMGKLRARVPAGAEGFIVASATSGLIDLGTEFALNFDADGRSRVMVLEGAAEVALLDASGSPQLTQLVEQSESFELDPRTGRIAAVVGPPAGFAPALAPRAPSLVLDPTYAGVVLQSRPRAYWRFEALAGGAIANEIPGGPPLRVNGPTTIVGGPEGNGCVAFKAGAPEQFLTTDNTWQLAREPGHAVEFWFLADHFEHAGLVGLFPLREFNPPEMANRYPHVLFVELLAYERQSLHPPATVRFHHRWPPRLTEENNVHSTIYAPGRWHHVVAQMDDGRMELYYDGVSGHSTPEPMVQPGVPCRLIVGRKTPDPLNRKDSRSFVGWMDELAIYDHPLSADEVRRHYQLADPARRPGSVLLDEVRQ